MKVVYIVHPIAGDVKGNLDKIKEISRSINLEFPDVVPFANYYLDCHSLDDSIFTERIRGIKNNLFLLRKGFIDEMWVYGNTISSGMKEEIITAWSLGIEVVCKGSLELIEAFKDLVNEVALTVFKNTTETLLECYKDMAIESENRKSVDVIKIGTYMSVLQEMIPDNVGRLFTEKTAV